MDTAPEVPPEILFPQPGELYRQFGVDIEILDVAPEYVLYKCSYGYLNGPPRRIARDAFQQNLKDKILERIR